MKASSGQVNLWVGRLVGDGDRYRLDQHLGGGGMGDVFMATDARLGKSVAVKLLKDSLAVATDLDFRERFERECSICASLKSVHIVQVSDYGVTSEGCPYYVMEYLQGQTLGQLLATRSRLSIQQTCNIITQVCAGLQLAHAGVVLWDRETNTSDQIKVVHRDLKPDNIFLTPTALGEFVKIIDFGIAKILSLQAEYTNVTGLFMGTCHYASPEQSEGSGEVDDRSDIYSLGVILYEMLTGIDPFGFDFKKHRITNTAWLAAHACKLPRPFRSLPDCAHLSAELEAVVMRCLEKSPQARFASVLELSEALQAASSVTVSETSRPDPNAETAVWTRHELADDLADYTAPPDASAVVPPPPQHKKRTPLLLMGAGALLMAIGSIYAVPRLFPALPALSTNPLVTPVRDAQPIALAETLSGSRPVWSAVVSRDGQTLIGAGEEQDGQFYPIKLWDLQTRQVLRVMSAHRDVVQSLSLSENGLLASGSHDRTVKIWNLATGELIETLEGHSAPVLSVALSRDGQTLISGGEDRTVRIWNLQTKASRTLSEHTDTVYSVALSPDGKTIASSSADKTIRLWDVATGELMRTLGEPGGHRDAVSAVAFSPDGQQIASAGWDGFVKLWNATTGQLIQTFEGHTDRVVAVTFLNPQTIASGSFDKTIKLWNTQTGRSSQTIPAHTNQVLSVTSLGDQTLVSSSSDTTIKLWR